MTKKEKFGCAIGLARLFITTPIWYYLLYKTLVMIEATDLMMFLFWVYFPFGMVISVIETVFKESIPDE